MADIPLKSLKLPGLSDTYTVPAGDGCTTVIEIPISISPTVIFFRWQTETSEVLTPFYMNDTYYYYKVPDFGKCIVDYTANGNGYSHTFDITENKFISMT